MGVMIVVSGLPASGKSGLGRSLGERLAMPVIDKDVILEALFDSLGSLGSPGSSGTKTAQPGRRRGALLARGDHPVRRTRELVEPRHRTRTDSCRRRHPGHHDPELTKDEIAARVTEVAASFRGPLRLGGPLLTLDTSRPVDVTELSDLLTSLLTSS